MPAPKLDQVNDRPLDDVGQTMSDQALVLARQQVDLARRELTTKARQAAPGAAMVGGAAFLGVLASGTGTAAVVLLFAGRPKASAAALGVTGAYAGAGALLAREGLERLRETGPVAPEDTVANANKTVRPAKRGRKSAPKPAGRPASRSRDSTKAQPSAARKRSKRVRRAAS
jgi:hypothetical protein